jgi:hypothetical protein
MKFYETQYDEYLDSVKNCNIHPELVSFIDNLPEKCSQMGNLIVYGPTGIGKYSQVLQILKKYSPSNFKYEKKITIQTDKNTYTYHISDIHYEIDMSLLGCNSKILWNEIFLQIVDIISVKTDKVGFIVCKNFHMIHGELLDIFYSYIQQYSKCYNTKSIFGSNIVIHFIIITENLSFMPNNILQSCYVLNIPRPVKQLYKNIYNLHNNEKKTISQGFDNLVNDTSSNIVKGTSKNVPENISNILLPIIDLLQENEITNIKELYSFSKIKKNTEIPKDIFNIVCDNILREILNHKKLSFTNFRDVIYDILIYNLEMVECLWYILYYLIRFHSEPIEKLINTNKKDIKKNVNKMKNIGYLSKKDISDILNKTHSFLKYYNNNYRPIYHLESIFFYIIVKLYNYELSESDNLLRT